MSKRLLIILMNTDPRNVGGAGRAPFHYAAVAAAMDCAVDVQCTAIAGRQMLKGGRRGLTVKPGDPKTVHD